MAPSIIITLSIAILVTTIMITSGELQGETAKSDTPIDWCYVSALPEDRFVCLPNQTDCNKAQSLDLFASSSCFKDKW